MEKIQGRNLCLVTLLRRLQKIGIFVKIQRTACKPLFIDAVKHNVKVFDVTCDAGNAIPVGTYLSQCAW